MSDTYTDIRKAMAGDPSSPAPEGKPKVAPRFSLADEAEPEPEPEPEPQPAALARRLSELYASRADLLEEKDALYARISAISERDRELTAEVNAILKLMGASGVKGRSTHPTRAATSGSSRLSKQTMDRIREQILRALPTSSDAALKAREVYDAMERAGGTRGTIEQIRSQLFRLYKRGQCQRIQDGKSNTGKPVYRYFKSAE